MSYEGKEVSKNSRSPTLLLDSPTIVELEMEGFTDNFNVMCALVRNLTNLQSLTFKARPNHKASFGDRFVSLAKESSLTELSLSGIALSYNVARTLCRTLAENKRINTLILKGCAIRNYAIELFVEHWVPDSSIHTIDLSDNDIRTTGAVMLIGAVSNHQAMEHLNINGSYFIGIEGLEEVALKLPNLALKELKMVGCSACYGFGREAKEFEMDCQRVSGLMLQGIKINSQLHTLDLLGNNLFDNDDASAQEFHYFVMCNRYTPLVGLLTAGGQEAVHPRQHLPISIWCHVFAKHSDNPNIIYHFLKQQPMLWPKHTAAVIAATTNGKRQRIA